MRLRSSTKLKHSRDNLSNRVREVHPDERDSLDQRRPVASPSRAQADIDRMALFVFGAMALLLIAPIALGFVGIDVGAGSDDRSEEMDGNATAPAETTVAEPSIEYGPETFVQVLAIEGAAIDENRTSVGAVELVFTPSAEAAPLDPANLTVTWIGAGSYDLSTTGEEGTFLAGVETVEATERGTLLFDLGTDDIDGIEAFGDRLEPGDEVTVILASNDGETVRETFEVPDEIPDSYRVKMERT